MRACPGEKLARNRILLFIATILHKFDIEIADGELPSRDVRSYPMSIIIHPPHFKVRFNLRKSAEDQSAQ